MDFETREIRKMEKKSRRCNDEYDGIELENNKEYGKVFLIILLLLANIAAISYILYYKGYVDFIIEKFTNTKQVEPTNKITAKSISIKDENINTLYNYILPIKDVLAVNDEIKAEKLTNDQILAIGCAGLKEEELKKEDKSYIISEQAIDNNIVKVLGKDFKYGNKSTTASYFQKYSSNLSGYLLLKYNENDKTYVASFDDNKPDISSYQKLISAGTKGKELYINAKVLYVSYDDGKGHYNIYSNRSNDDTSKLEEIKDDQFTEEKLDDLYLKGSEVTYVFIKENNNYVFKYSRLKENKG